VVVLGIDIGGAQIKAGMVDEQGAIIASRTIQTPADLDGFLSSLHDAIRWLLEATALPAGVGVGCKGIIDPDTTRIEVLPGHLHFLQGLRLADLVGLLSTSRFSPTTTRAWPWPARWSGALLAAIATL